MNDTMTDIFGNSEQQVNNQINNQYNQYNQYNQQVSIPSESVTTNTIPMQDIFTPIVNNQSMNVEQSNVISMEDLIKEEEQTSQKVVVKKKDKVLMVQLALIIGWVVTTVLVYYFGYGLFEPFIDV